MTISLNENKAPIADALARLFHQGGAHYVLDLPVTGVVTCHIASKMPFRDAVSTLLNSCTTTLSYSVKDGVYHIGPLGTITGKVVPPSGIPAAGFTVVAYPAIEYLPPNQLSKIINTTRTDAKGNYTIVLRKQPPPLLNGSRLPIIFNSGQFRIGAKGYLVTLVNTRPAYIKPPDQNIDPSTRSDRTVKNVNFVLLPSPTVVIKATDAITGAPVPGIAVKYDAPWPSPGELGVTDQQGEIRSRVPTLKTYLHAILKISPSAYEFAPGYGSGERTSFEMNTSPGKTVVWNLKTYGSEKKSNWHGVVLLPDGKPVGAGIPVSIQRATFAGSATALTDSQGRFSTEMSRIDGAELPNSPDYGMPVVTAHSGDLVAAIAVTPDESWNGMTLRFARGAAISGEVADPHGKPATHVNVSLCGAMLAVRLIEPMQVTATTDESGRFDLRGIPPGSYQIKIHGGGFGDLAIPASAKPGARRNGLQLAEGEHRDLGKIIDPIANQSLTGIVVDEKGDPVFGSYITVMGKHTHQVAISQRDGTFHVYNLPAEPLTMTVGASNQVTTKEVLLGQTSIRVTLPPKIVEDVYIDSHPVIPKRSTPSGAPKMVPTAASTLLNGLALVVRPEASGGFAAEIYRPNSFWPTHFFLPPPFGGSFANSNLMVWHGNLPDLDGMKLTVQHDHGVLADRAGRALWSGTLMDPPDYAVTVVTQNHSSKTTVRNAAGKVLWSGVGMVEQPFASDGNIRVIGPDHKIAWERGIGNARVSVARYYNGQLYARQALFDGTITMHMVSTTATLADADGKILLTRPTQTVTFTLTGFPPVPESLIKNPKANLAASARLFREWIILPQIPQTALGVQNTPPDSKLTFIDSAGKPLGPTITLNASQPGLR